MNKNPKELWEVLQNRQEIIQKKMLECCEQFGVPFENLQDYFGVQGNFSDEQWKTMLEQQDSFNNDQEATLKCFLEAKNGVESELKRMEQVSKK